MTFSILSLVKKGHFLFFFFGIHFVFFHSITHKKDIYSLSSPKGEFLFYLCQKEHFQIRTKYIFKFRLSIVLWVFGKTIFSSPSLVKTSLSVLKEAILNSLWGEKVIFIFWLSWKGHFEIMAFVKRTFSKFVFDK